MGDSGETILSAGIDIGTTTTQVVFSRLSLKNTGGFGMAPKIEIVSKEIVYRSGVHFTPLLNGWEIDGPAVLAIIMEEYRRAGFTPEQVDTGAVIITGETSRKRNAREVCESVSGFAGKFVVASAGPDLESVLAGKGAGCAALSEQPEYAGKICCNLDVGGGTTNLCCFLDGEVVDTACLDIGGRLIRLDGEGRAAYIAPKLGALLARHGVSLAPGCLLTAETAETACRLMCHVLLACAGLAEETPDLALMATHRGLRCKPDVFTFSGGVADCIVRDFPDFAFSDIGVFLGRALRQSPFFTEGRSIASRETLRATVIGAGSFSMELSGSTVEYQNCPFPIKSVPVFRVAADCVSPPAGAAGRIRAALAACGALSDRGPMALSFAGLKNPAFSQIEELARELADVAGAFGKGGVFVLVMEEDMAKALGQALKRRMGREFPLICVDGISAKSGDFIDLGLPVAGGKAIPAVVKTLAFL